MRTLLHLIGRHVFSFAEQRLIGMTEMPEPKQPEARQEGDGQPDERQKQTNVLTDKDNVPQKSQERAKQAGETLAQATKEVAKALQGLRELGDKAMSASDMTKDRLQTIVRIQLSKYPLLSAMVQASGVMSPEAKPAAAPEEKDKEEPKVEGSRGGVESLSPKERAALQKDIDKLPADLKEKVTGILKELTPDDVKAIGAMVDHFAKLTDHQKDIAMRIPLDDNGNPDNPTPKDTADLEKENVNEGDFKAALNFYRNLDPVVKKMIGKVIALSKAKVFGDAPAGKPGEAPKDAPVQGLENTPTEIADSIRKAISEYQKNPTENTKAQAEGLIRLQGYNPISLDPPKVEQVTGQLAQR